MRQIILGTIVLLLTSCASKEATNVTTLPDYFPGAKGCFLLYNVKTDKFEKEIGADNCKQQFPACSTFKFPLAVIGFDSGVLKNGDTKFKWNGVMDARPEVNHDQTAKTWMANSVVWYSQIITKKLGEKKLQKYLNDFDYGNKDLKGGLNEAWLHRPNSGKPMLAISPYEQIEFMKKFWSGKLPVKKKAFDLTREITFIETSPKGFALHGKTGSNYYDDKAEQALGWFIGHSQNKDAEYIVVTQFADTGKAVEPGYGGPRARKITKRILEDSNLW